MDELLKEFSPSVYKRKQMHLKETDSCKYDNQMLTLFTSSLYFSALVLTYAASYVTRSYGRRASIICGSISFFLGAILNAGAKNITLLIVGRCLLGGGIGFGNQGLTLLLPYDSLIRKKQVLCNFVLYHLLSVNGLWQEGIRAHEVKIDKYLNI